MGEPLFYRKHVFVCTNQRPADDPRGSCWAKGAVGLRNYMKDRAKELGLSDVRINAAGCLDRCECGPSVVIYPEGVWYTVRTKEDVDEVLRRAVMADERVERLVMPADGCGKGG